MSCQGKLLAWLQLVDNALPSRDLVPHNSRNDTKQPQHQEQERIAFAATT